ncbi:MAG TPA: hypothetical protein VKZ41_00120 [Gemmatimonadales bacterium]|nr:hypothetical protein [Gemmatimonadales bacterium]
MPRNTRHARSPITSNVAHGVAAAFASVDSSFPIRRIAFVAVAGIALLVGSSSAALAQFPGLPVIESGFFHPGRAAGFNLGLAEDATAYVAAASWVPASAGWKATAGLGYLRLPDDGALALGLRAAYPLPFAGAGDSTSTIGIAAFAGGGGYHLNGVTSLAVPLGLTAGYRGALPGGRAYAVHAAPFLVYNHASGTLSGSDTNVSASGFVIRLGVGGDFALTPRAGLSLALEFGQDPDSDDPGTRGTVLGVGASLRF